MHSGESDPILIGIDWGTTSCRAFLIGSHGKVLDRVATTEGIMQVPNGDFEQVLHRLLDPWTKDYSLPVIASGMITSRNGWVETPYVPLPSGAEALSNALVPLLTGAGLSLQFVTGLSTEHRGAPDVMRGEETQIVGACEAGLLDGVFVMPGTHSKWVTVSNGQIQDFATSMTGEVFQALRGHTILGTLMEDGPFDEQIYRDGVAAGLDAGLNLLHTLFHVRTLPLFGKIASNVVGDYLSGMLIGAEIHGATSGKQIDGPVTIVGRDDLAQRYDIALQVMNRESRRAPEDIVARGHFAIANSAGLLK